MAKNIPNRKGKSGNRIQKKVEEKNEDEETMTTKKITKFSLQWEKGTGHDTHKPEWI